MTEAEFQQRVIDTARLYGWRVAHHRPARTKHGWRTPTQGDPGFPDLVLARGGKVILAELKSTAGRLRPDQTEWLQQCGTHARKWSPKDWPDVLHELSGGDRPDEQLVNLLVEN